MTDATKGKPHRSYREGGRPKPDAQSEQLPEKAPNKSRDPRQPGQGGEGFSKGYGGSGGSGTTGPAGPEDDAPPGR